MTMEKVKTINPARREINHQDNELNCLDPLGDGISELSILQFAGSIWRSPMQHVFHSTNTANHFRIAMKNCLLI